MNYDSIIILGATATGKTSFSVALAKKLNGEIINADSQQIYKNLNIGTAKITEHEKQEIPHHLFDLTNIGEEFSVSDFSKLAKEMIEDIKSRNRLPIIVGGTGFYIESLLYKLDFGNTKKDIKLRKYYEGLAFEKGNEYLHKILLELDEDTAKNLHPNDVKRVIRAIEIAKTSNIKKSEQTKELLNFIKPLIINLYSERSILYERINNRVEAMVKDGLINEVSQLKMQGFYDDKKNVSLPIGYSEWKEYYESSKSQEECIELIKQHTRNYAKRQITWFKKYKSDLEFDLTKTTIDDAIEQTINIFCE